MTAEEMAHACAAAMWADDQASQRLGMELTDVGPGRATVTFTVSEAMVNGHGLCHGGYIFTLADSAFAFACNSHNRIAVAQHNTITYVAPGKLGDRLTAVAKEIALFGRSGICDVRVSDQNGKLIAEFRGASRTIEGRHFEEEAAGEAVS